MEILSEWLTHKADNAPVAKHRGLAPMAALRIRMAWQKLKSRALEDDEVWAFSNPSNTWKKWGKRTGYALVRDRVVVDSVVVTNERG